MRKIFTLLALFVVLATTAVTAQTRYIDAMFQVGEPETDVVYGTNISILTGSPMPTDLLMDVYQPSGDDSEQLRPVVVSWHTGNFLPKIANFSAYGDKNDSINVEIVRRLVSTGYVGISATYRKGWLPTATDQDTRTGTLLKAVYRASQDAHTLARFLRKSVVEDGNPYRIDTSRIAYIGTGSGGYVVMAHATLDRVEEIARNAQFYDQDGNLLVDEALDSNPFGTTATPLNQVNHGNYSSAVAISVNIAGALGDTTWMEGADREPMILGYHSLTDPFAPYRAGTVVVPVTNQPVVDVLGTNTILERANALGLNDAIAEANEVPLDAKFGQLATTINAINAQYAQATVASPIPTATMETFQFSRPNMFPFRSNRILGAPYNWFDTPTLSAFVAGWNATFPDDPRSVDDIIAGEVQTNPNYDDPAAAKAYVDTMMAHFIPRAFIGMDLQEVINSVDDVLSPASTGLEVFPNPTAAGFTVRASAEFPVRSVRLFDLNGRRVLDVRDINTTSRFISRGNLPRGTYLLQVQFDEGSTTTKLLFE